MSGDLSLRRWAKQAAAVLFLTGATEVPELLAAREQIAEELRRLQALPAICARLLSFTETVNDAAD